jgi:hypothetical protein
VTTVLKNNVDVAMFLVAECHANPTLPDKEGFTPMHTACRSAVLHQRLPPR